MAGGLMYPKGKKKKKRMTHPGSIMKQEPGLCYLCVRLHDDYTYHRYLEKHHVYGGTGNRKVSEENGFTVRLCPAHHRTGPEAVHVCAETRLLLKKDVQREYEKTHTRQQFRRLIANSFLEEGEEDDGKSI